MKKVNIAYLAGLFDGEGSIFIYRRNYYKKRHKKNFYLSPQITISNNNNYVLLVIKKWIGFGNVFSYKRKEMDHLTYRWSISGIRRCLKFTKLLYGKCIIKNEQLKFMEEFCESRINRPNIFQKISSGKRKIPHRPPYNNREFEIVKEIRKCNLEFSNKSRVEC